MHTKAGTIMENDTLLKKGIGELQRSLERFESYNNGFILPDTLLVLRLDAHRIGEWDSSVGEYPCGEAITAAFHKTAEALMTSSFRVVMAYVHGDEISLVIDPAENNNPLRRSKLISHISSAAAIHFLQASGHAALFDTHLSELPSVARLVEYFFWQRRYCYRNALTIALRKKLITSGLSNEETERQLHGASEAQKAVRLAELGSPIDSIPHTTRRGALLYWESLLKNDREHFRIKTELALSDDDALFLSKLRHLLQEAIGIELPQPVTAPRAVANTDISITTAAKGVHQQRTYRNNRKTNVSVIKMAANLKKG